MKRLRIAIMNEIKNGLPSSNQEIICAFKKISAVLTNKALMSSITVSSHYLSRGYTNVM